MKIGRIPYINCYPVYGAIDRGVVTLDAKLVDGVPTDLNRRMAAGELDISVVSAVEYARDSDRYLLLPDLAISCDGAVRSVMLFSRYPASELTSRRVLVSRSSMTSVALLELLFENVWRAKPRFVAGDAEVTVECAPGTLTPEMISTLQCCGVNRVSLGVQSFVDQESRAVGRLHTRQVVLDDVLVARVLVPPAPYVLASKPRLHEAEIGRR